MESDSHIHIQLECSESARNRIIAPCSCHCEALRHSTSIHKTHTHTLSESCVCMCTHICMNQPFPIQTHIKICHSRVQDELWYLPYLAFVCFTCLWLHQLFWPIYSPVSAWYMSVCSYIAVVCLSCWKIWREKKAANNTLTAAWYTHRYWQKEELLCLVLKR